MFSVVLTFMYLSWEIVTYAENPSLFSFFVIPMHGWNQITINDNLKKNIVG